MKPASSKAKGRRCRRCKVTFDPSGTDKAICFDCSTKCCKCSVILTKENQDNRSFELRTTYICKSCVAKSIKNTPDRVTKQKVYDLKRNYNLTLSEYRELSFKQDHSCKICGVIAKLHVDHGHSNGKVRGLLCTQCNVGLGYFKDSIQNLEKAKEYLLASIIE